MTNKPHIIYEWSSWSAIELDFSTEDTVQESIDVLFLTDLLLSFFLCMLFFFLFELIDLLFVFLDIKRIVKDCVVEQSSVNVSDEITLKDQFKFMS